MTLDGNESHDTPPAPDGPDHLSIDRIRYNISKPYLSGTGIEIGPGSHPQTIDKSINRLCFDIRSRASVAEYVGTDVDSVPVIYPIDDIPKLFPQGVDFIIAHNVLEHSPNPIRELNKWHNYLKKDGIMVISMPHHAYCEDSDRVLPSPEHILFDYLFEKDGRDYESREHVYSFMFGWSAVGASANMEKMGFVHDALNNAKRDDNDLHWHALDESLMQFIIACAAVFIKKGVIIECIGSPNTTSEYRTKGDVIFIYRLVDKDIKSYWPWSDKKIKDILNASSVRLSLAKKMLDDVLMYE